MINFNKLNMPFETLKKRDVISFTCDYCGMEFLRSITNYKRSIKIVKKDCCNNKECKARKLKECNLKIYGVESIFQREDIKKKIKETIVEKYGVENPMQNEKIRKRQENTCVENYGTNNVFKNKIIREKIKKTNIEKYGVENPMQSEKVKEKFRNTCVKNHSVRHHWLTKEGQLKRKKNIIEKYGQSCTLLIPEIQEKIRQTNIERYGVENPLSSPEIQEKIRQTNVERYGVENPLSSQEIQEKKRQTNIEKYGSAYPTHKFGKTQTEIQDWLNSNGFNFNSDHTVLNGKELDLYDSNLKFAIEYCGLHWHHENSPQPRLRIYHFNKWEICKKKNIQLITIFEDEWLDNQDVIKSVLLSKLGKFEKRIYARKCLAKEITKKEFVKFCDQYHIQRGNNLAKTCFGLFYEDELVGIMDLGVHHRKKLENEMVLTRLCFKKDYQIVGGASKLFSACISWCKNNNVNKIISWSDNRWSNGSVYENLNFKMVEQLGPDYAYVDIKKPNKRISKQSQKKSNSGCPADITEKNFALQSGLSRIWDCGKIRWEFNV